MHASTATVREANDDDDSHRLPLAFGRIPPPPLLPGEVPGAIPHPWILRVKCQTTPTRSNHGGGVVRIQVSPNLTAESLGQCISQAVAAYSGMPPETVVVSRVFMCMCDCHCITMVATVGADTVTGDTLMNCQ
jgi:hypothetical protein